MHSLRRAAPRALLCLAALLGSPISAQAAGTEGGIVRILVLTDLSNIYSDISGQGTVTAVEMASAEMQATVAGSEVEIISRDTNLDPDTAVEALRAANADTPVDMVTGMPSSGTGLAVQKFAERHDIITLHSGASAAFLSGRECSPLAVQWGFNTYALAHSAAAGLVKQGADRWYFITADYNYGHDVKNQVAKVVQASGGKIIGESVVTYPANRTQMAAAISAAQAAKPAVIGLANGGNDLHLAIRQFYEQNLAVDGIAPVANEFYIADIRRLGTYVTAGLRFTTSFYWNRSPSARKWSLRFQTRNGEPPTSMQASAYSATRHYLEAIDAAGTDQPETGMKTMRARPVDDGVFVDDGKVLITNPVISIATSQRVFQPLWRGAWCSPVATGATSNAVQSG